MLSGIGAISPASPNPSRCDSELILWNLNHRCIMLRSFKPGENRAQHFVQRPTRSVRDQLADPPQIRNSLRHVLKTRLLSLLIGNVRNRRMGVCGFLNRSGSSTTVTSSLLPMLKALPTASGCALKAISAPPTSPTHPRQRVWSPFPKTVMGSPATAWRVKVGTTMPCCPVCLGPIVLNNRTMTVGNFFSRRYASAATATKAASMGRLWWFL